MIRRAFLTTGGSAAIGFGIGGCAPRRPGARLSVRAPVRLPPVNASWDRIIRTTVGLRPHRDAGFVLETGKLDDKTLSPGWTNMSRPNKFVRLKRIRAGRIWRPAW